MVVKRNDMNLYAFPPDALVTDVEMPPARRPASGSVGAKPRPYSGDTDVVGKDVRLPPWRPRTTDTGAQGRGGTGREGEKRGGRGREIEWAGGVEVELAGSTKGFRGSSTSMTAGFTRTRGRSRRTTASAHSPRPSGRPSRSGAQCGDDLPGPGPVR